MACMNCQSTSERAFEELFIQINREVKSVDRGFNDWVGPEMIQDYQCRGLVNKCGALFQRSNYIPINCIIYRGNL